MYSTTVVDLLRVANISFNSTTALRLANFEGLASNNTIIPVNARTLQDMKKNHEENRKDDRRGRFIN